MVSDPALHKSPEHLLEAAYTALGRNDPLRAEALCETVFECHPRMPEALHCSGLVQHRLDRHDRSRRLLEQARRLEPGNPRFLLNQARVLSEQQRAHEAWNLYRRAAALLPNSAEAHYGLAISAAQLGDFESLRREAAHSLQLDPRCYTAWYQLTLCPGSDDEELADRMHEALARVGDDPAAWLLHMAHGRILDRAGHHDAAFAAFRAAQRQRARVFSLDYARERQYYAAVRRCLGADFVRRRIEAGTEDFSPIFIVGMPRSGTSLVEAVIGAHPDVMAGGEMRFAHNWMQRNMHSQTAELAPARLARANDAELARLAREWRAFVDEAGGSHLRVTDKFPFNFFLLGVIAVLFPRAQIVHVRRDPRDTCVSCYTTAFAGGLPADLSELGAYYIEYEALMTHWRRMLGTDRIIEVEYERLVRTPEPAARKLLAALNLDWHPECLSFHESTRPVTTASLYQVRQPIYHDAIGTWRRFQAHLLPLLTALHGEGPQ
ncbi:MAG: sulfotransferase [Gammaproteobacteria bacterium]|nr:sulfotransferase [Gammaproteobacteria bacterium]